MRLPKFPSGRRRRGWSRSRRSGCCFHPVLVAQRSDRPGGGECDGRPGARFGEDAGRQGSSTRRFAGAHANYMCRQMREHVDVPDTSELLAKLGANGFAVVVVSSDVPVDPSPLPVREGAV
jgi:hypothetical protein